MGDRDKDRKDDSAQATDKDAGSWPDATRPNDGPNMKRSLGAVLAFGLAGLQFLAILVVVFSSYVTSEGALLKHSRDLLRDVGINTIEHSKGFLSPAQGAAELAARLAQNRVIASDDPERLEQLLFQQLQIAPQFAGVYFGRYDGSFVFVMRSPDGRGVFRTKIIRNDNGQRTVELIWRNDDFSEVAREMDPEDPYDPRTRPWYVKAQEQRTTIWTDPYIFFSSHQPGITLAAPVLSDDGTMRGAVGVDIEISMISDFLSRLNIGMNGRAMIINANGDVIAHPEQVLLKTRSADGSLRFSDISEFGDPIARAAFGKAALAGNFPVTEETPSQFSYDGASYVSIIMPVISDTLPWTIAVYAPEDDFTGTIKKNRVENIWLAALVAVVTGGIGLILADFIHRPVRAFAVRTALISQGEVPPDAPAPRTYRELERANDALVQQIVARRKAEREYGQTFNMASRGMAQLSPDTGAFLRVNSRLCEITGYGPDELATMRFIDLVHPDEAEVLRLSPLPQGAEVAMNRELRCLRKDGTEIRAATNAILIRDGAGRVLHIVVTMDDVTQARRSEVQIEQLNRDLSHLARGNTMGQMAAGLAHELNQPLAAIAQNADTALLMLDDQSRTGTELHDVLTEIENQSLRAGEIIRALRSFIRKDQGARSQFDFAALLEQTLHLVQAEAAEGRATIVTRIEPDLPMITGNRVQIAQVIVNLLHNAFEAMSAEGGADRQVTISAALDGRQLLVSIQDTGPGIPPDINLFAQFETTKPTGMGLGLSICRSIIEAHGGRIWHSSDSDIGARFNFTLPLPPLA